MNQTEREMKYRFFSHTACEYFPCHPTAHPENFNCLFCYCPLYVLGKACGGAFRYTESGIKDCSGCLLPHSREAYDHIVKRFPDLLAVMRQAEEQSEETKRI